MSVITMRQTLTEADVRALVKGESDQDRAFAASKICRSIEYADLTEDERAHAEAILRIIAKDAAGLVRRALVTTLAASTKLPPDVARRLAEDVDSIALPILQRSPMLSDADLVEVLRSAGPTRQIAIASRPALSETVTDAVVEFAVPEAIKRALANDNARFSPNALIGVLEKHGDEEGLTEAMARRRALPVLVVEKLITMVAGEVFDHLVNHHELPPQLAIDLAAGARERASLDLVEQAGLQRDHKRFAQQMALHGRLTPSFLMRAMCLGHMAFVEHALAELAGLPHHRAWIMVHDNGALGLKALFERANLPLRLFPAFRAAIDVYHQLEREGLAGDRQRLRQRMIERVLTLFQNVPRDELDYLLDKLNATRDEAARMLAASTTA